MLCSDVLKTLSRYKLSLILCFLESYRFTNCRMIKCQVLENINLKLLQENSWTTQPRGSYTWTRSIINRFGRLEQYNPFIKWITNLFQNPILVIEGALVLCSNKFVGVIWSKYGNSRKYFRKFISDLKWLQTTGSLVLSQLVD